MISPITHISPLVCIRRARLLETEGQVKVRVGQRVSAIDVIAEESRSSKHMMLNVRQTLGLKRGVPLRKVLKYKIGDELKEGDLLAEQGGMFKRVVVAPSDCRIVAVSSGKVLLELRQASDKLLAGMTGQVIEVFPNKGVMIESQGSLLQGVWGNGAIDMGILMVKAETPDHVFTSDELDVSLRGAVVFAGHCAEKKVLEMAADLPLRGLILGSMDSSLIPFVEKLEFPVIVLEGFGNHPVSTAAYKILATSEKRELSLNAVKWDRFTGIRPEIVIPLPTNGQIPTEIGVFQPGKTVRVQMPPYTGRVGVLQRINTETNLPNDLRVKTADVKFENKEQVAVPLANLDVLE